MPLININGEMFMIYATDTDMSSNQVQNSCFCYEQLLKEAFSLVCTRSVLLQGST